MKQKPHMPLISEVLHLAADKYLAVDSDDYFRRDHRDSNGKKYETERFSCYAIYAAIEELNVDSHYLVFNTLHFQIKQGLKNMGLNTSSTREFIKLEQKIYTNVIKCTKESQEARYFWLKWAALMAEEQGV